RTGRWTRPQPRGAGRAGWRRCWTSTRNWPTSWPRCSPSYARPPGGGRSPPETTGWPPVGRAHRGDAGWGGRRGDPRGGTHRAPSGAGAGEGLTDPGHSPAGQHPRPVQAHKAIVADRGGIAAGTLMYQRDRPPGRAIRLDPRPAVRVPTMSAALVAVS